MATFRLLRGELCSVDDEDLPLVDAKKWFAIYVFRAGRRVLRAVGASGGTGNPVILLHRFIMQAPPDLLVDHRDRDVLNNTKANLRFATRAENVRNRGRSIKNRSGYKGVTAYKKRFRAEITANGEVHKLGSFDTPYAAHAAYCAAAKALHGEFACTD